MQTIEEQIAVATTAIPSIPNVKASDVHVDLSEFPKVEVPKVNVDVSGAVAKAQAITKSPEFQENLRKIEDAVAGITAIVN